VKASAYLVARCANGHETGMLVERNAPIDPEYAALLRALIERASEVEGGCGIVSEGARSGAAVSVEVES
jgi:hypothetical protein